MPDTPTASVKIMPNGPGYNHHTLEIQSATEGDGKTNVCGIFPSMTMAIRNQSAMWLSIQPINSKRLRYQAWIARDMQHQNATVESIKEQIGTVMDFMAEDKHIISGVQKGLETGVGNKGPMHEMEMNNGQFGRYYAEKMLDK